MPITNRCRPNGDAGSNIHYRYGTPETSYRDRRTRTEEVSVLDLGRGILVSARDRRPVENRDRLTSYSPARLVETN